jgi:translation initiation factor IF-1
MVRATIRRNESGFQLEMDAARAAKITLRDGEVFIIPGDDAAVEIVPVDSQRGKVVAAYERIELKSTAEARKSAGR